MFSNGHTLWDCYGTMIPCRILTHFCFVPCLFSGCSVGFSPEMARISKPLHQRFQSELVEENQHVFEEFEVCISGCGFGVFGLCVNRVPEGSADHTFGRGQSARRL